jgi:hypothetical protein
VQNPQPGVFSACTFLLAGEGHPVTKMRFLFLGVLCTCAAGCSSEPGPIEKTANSPIVPAAADAPVDPPPQTEPALDDNAETADSAADSDDDSPGPASLEPQVVNLKESGISFVAPGEWKRVPPQHNIIEAEFVLPHAPGDEFDGRLTLMSSGGLPNETIATKTSEFNMEPGEKPTQEVLSIGGYEAVLVDLRGEWKGPVFQPITPPRGDYRMLLFVIPWSERSGFYAKLTGPRTTIAAYDNAFREFLRSAKITREAPK